MEICNALSYNKPSKASYGLIHDGLVLILNDPPDYVTIEDTGRIALRNVKYLINDGILYIKGIRIYYCHISEILKPIKHVGNNKFYTILEENNSLIENPFWSQNLSIKKWWGIKKVIKGVDLTGLSHDIDSNYKLKQESPYQCAMSYFKLIEKK
jgi:hypothetical protein